MLEVLDDSALTEFYTYADGAELVLCSVPG